jgi:hypothetical protein
MRSLGLPNEMCEAPPRDASRSAPLSEKGQNTLRPLAITQSLEWVTYFQDNASRQRAIPWELGAGLSAKELTAIAPSLRGWQLGETSDGSHLLLAARYYAFKVGDPDFIEAVRLFIVEEQRHGNNLGRFLDLAGVERAKSDGGDSLFRALRYALPTMEVWATPVVMVETHAMVYYDAIREATGSVVLRSICEQILADEVAHIRFQCERLAILHRRRAQWLLLLTMALHRVMFAAITIAVWLGHRRALRAGGYGFSQFWRNAWARMRHAWQIMAPRAYRWADPGQQLHPFVQLDDQ